MSDRARIIYEEYAAGVAYIATRTPDGEERIGSSYHVGEGVFVTARHVVEGKQVTSIATTEYAYEVSPQEFQREGVRILRPTHSPSSGKIKSGPFFHPDPRVDIAALVIEGIDAPTIPLGGHMDDWIGSELVLAPVTVMGYPPIPFSKEPTLVATRAEINAVIDKYTGGHPHFILSSTARGGFSGGLPMVDYGFSLGIITESLVGGNNPPELGYFAVLSVEPVYVCLAHHRILPAVQKEGLEGLWDENKDGP